jgi:hypothetical protein
MFGFWGSSLVPVFASTNGAAHLTQDEEDDPDYQDNNADRPQNADAQDPAQDQQDETKNNHCDSPSMLTVPAVSS